MSDSFFRDIPEFLETRVNESLEARSKSLSQFKELGPADHVHTTKVGTRNPSKEVGTYHFVSGIDASSSASLAAYLNTLSYSLDKSQQWFSKSQTWSINHSVYCCYNAFSRLDVRVEAKVPGGVDTYAIDENGQKHKMDVRMWVETYMSSVLRSLLYSDELYSRFTGHRKFNPIPNPDSELRFFEAFEELFPMGHILGSSPEIRIPTNVNNHLVRGFFVYVCQNCRFSAALNSLEKLHINSPEVSVLLAQLYLFMDHEVHAVRVLHEALQKQRMSADLLVVQARYLVSKERFDLALTSVKRAVHASPSEFVPWICLAEVYLHLEDFDSALLALNSCPMYTYYERDVYPIPPPTKAHLPLPVGFPKEELEGENGNGRAASVDLIDPYLARLPSPSLRGTFAKVYELLTLICSKIGWDELLRIRSSVFVMEEEYRSLNDNSKPNPETKEDVITGEPSVNKQDGNESHLDKPEAIMSSSAQNLNVHNKRLCERWLDNLFMVLYEDLRVFTIWRAEYTHFRSQGLVYRKSPMEWEILGEVAFRLHHRVEAVEAFCACLENMFSFKAWKTMLIICAEDNNIELVLTAIAKLTLSNYRWYQEYSPFLLEHIKNRIMQDGALKMKSILASTRLDPYILNLIHKLYFEWAIVFQIPGHEL
ncbi:exomer complex ChAPs family (Chs5p-Arf1p-binding) protein Bch1 [Schizosaccharomyces osmophilus]|uniref:Exomer complex ChAPs family (Chs5p-Arf1p-binding) protein Bch1 n=1 Tax=Schizosaccharomyces osmophilus TaxID=2545709 RepID=A0AAF0AVQ9_9SCHI|nr:exomer complex ChAPs family (Chs5p-Arf1p-binding) protein Bch1 [Schizosaccharomyces osmophilus]WBW72723.1 exomer complex ChAPs family (Chs5p-Arf1p-binding) protein Bch1 [Schizosaccharomyces osmophilus]